MVRSKSVAGRKLYFILSAFFWIYKVLSNGASLNEKTRPMQSTAPKQNITRLQKLYTVNIYIILYLKFELSNEKARFVPREYKINYDITLYVVTLRAGVPFDCSPGNMG